MNIDRQKSNEKQAQYMISRSDKNSILYANSAFARAAGYPINDVIGSSYLRYLDPNTPSEVLKDIAATLATGTRWEGILGMRCRDGEILFTRTSMSPWYENGRLVGTTTVRTGASEHEIDRARALHQQLAKAASWRGLQGGRPVFKAWATPFNAFRINRHTAALVAFCALPGTLTGAMLMLTEHHGAHVSTATLSWALGVSTLLAMAASATLRRRMSAPLLDCENSLHLIAAGELTYTGPGKETAAESPLTNALSLTRASLISMVSELRTELSEMTTSIDQLSTGNIDLSSRTESQAAATAEITASLGGLVELVSKTTGHAEEAERVAKSATHGSVRGIQAVQSVVECMAEIAEGAEHMKEVTKAIESIAAQTNLLALNAAVEAARAGEHGRGFSVVAQEVRRLAARAAEATADIRTLIQQSLQRAESGQNRVGVAHAVIGELAQAVTTVGSLMGEVAGASKAQSVSLDQIHQVLGGIDDDTQRNAALVEQTAAAMEALAIQAHALESTAAVFR
ncbi:methyl-accepting chemotaxis protein [Caballeronia sordidicola]|uniref:methyl-accepting chemotaxis protein n=1 Tax=Caballeronia sordidicola TaxID=196367 RepID=UPI00068F22DC|nr:methyl-accepting chemotaxis protein [Caballeronia sordidicola]